MAAKNGFETIKEITYMLWDGELSHNGYMLYGFPLILKYEYIYDILIIRRTEITVEENHKSLHHETCSTTDGPINRFAFKASKVDQNIYAVEPITKSVIAKNIDIKKIAQPNLNSKVFCHYINFRTNNEKRRIFCMMDYGNLRSVEIREEKGQIEISVSPRFHEAIIKSIANNKLIWSRKGP